MSQCRTHRNQTDNIDSPRDGLHFLFYVPDGRTKCSAEIVTQSAWVSALFRCLSSNDLRPNAWSYRVGPKRFLIELFKIYRTVWNMNGLESQITLNLTTFGKFNCILAVGFVQGNKLCDVQGRQLIVNRQHVLSLHLFLLIRPRTQLRDCYPRETFVSPAQRAIFSPPTPFSQKYLN